MDKNNLVKEVFGNLIDADGLKSELMELDNYFVRFYLEKNDTSLNDMVLEKHSLLHSLAECL